MHYGQLISRPKFRCSASKIVFDENTAILLGLGTYTVLIVGANCACSALTLSSVHTQISKAPSLLQRQVSVRKEIPATNDLRKQVCLLVCVLVLTLCHATPTAGFIESSHPIRKWEMYFWHISVIMQMLNQVYYYGRWNS